MKRFFILLLFIPVIAFAAFQNSTGLIDVPTAEVQKNGQLNASLYFSAAAFSFAEDAVPFDYNLSVTYGLFDKLDLSLNMYTFTDFTLQAQYNILSAAKSFADVSVGMTNITYREYIDEGGGGSDVTSGMADHAYLTRAADWFSLYAVATKDLGQYGKYTLGIGRGEFVGFGRGQYLSTAAFFTTDQLLNGTSDYMFGLFGGVEVPIVAGLSFLGDLTGRDVNLGLRYKINNLQVNAALTHAELFTSLDPDMRPRADIGVNYTFEFGGTEKKQAGFLIINVADNSSNALLPFTLTFEETTIKPIKISNGYAKLQLNPGKYTIKIEAEAYKWQKRIFTITNNATSELNVKLNKKDDTEKKNHDKAITLAKDAKEKLNKGDIAGALKKLDEAKQLAPDDPTILAYMQEANTKKLQMINTYKQNAIMYEGKGWTKSAISEWNALLVLDKNNAEAKEHIAALQTPVKKETATTTTTTTKTETKKTETVKKDPEKIYEEGYMAFLNGDYKTAIKKFEEVLKIDPNHEKAQKYLDKAKKRI